MAAAAAALAIALTAPPVFANGRMPGATELALDPNDPSHIVVRATFGLVQSRDAGATWQWICEQAIDVRGEADPPVAVVANGNLVLLPPIGGALISADRGCTWSAAPAPLAGIRTVDLTRDPSDAARLLVLSSTVDAIDDQGVVQYENTIVETPDSAASWVELARLAPDFGAETLEVAPSDPQRIYVSGTSNQNPLLGIVERSEDGGETWTRATLALPQGSGSIYVSAIHPTDPDRLWIRVPARGDVFGLFPASLLVSSDKGETWDVLASTERAMFGFALSPDGTELAYGGPFDGLYAGPSGGTEFTKTSALGVRCLRWNENGLYACGSQPGGPFTIGRSTDRGATFETVYDAARTCPTVCADAEAFETDCRAPWGFIGPAIGAGGELCEVEWNDPLPDAGVGGTGADAGGTGSAAGAGGMDAGTPATGASPSVADASVDPRPQPDDGCSCRAARARTASPLAVLAVASLMGWFLRLSPRRDQSSHSGAFGSSRQR